MKIAEDVHVVEHRRVLGGDWLRVMTVGKDLLEWAQDCVADSNAASGAGDWRIRTVGDSQAPVKVAPPRNVSKPSLRERVRFWWVMRFSKRAR